MPNTNLYEEDLSKLKSWVLSKNSSSYDHFDFWSHPLLSNLYGKFHSARYRPLIRLVQGLFHFFPLFLRKLLRIRPACSAGTLCHEINALLISDKRMGGQRNQKLIQSRLERLLTLRDSDSNAWGLPYKWPHPHGRVWPASLPLAYTTCRAIESFLRYEEYSGDFSFRSEWSKAIEFLVARLPKVENENGIFISYCPYERVWVVNIQADVAYILNRLQFVGICAGHDLLIKGLLKAVLSEQTAEGRWPYFCRNVREGSKGAPVYDSLHTAMILSSLSDISRRGEFAELISPTVLLGARTYLEDFFDLNTGRPFTLLHSRRLTAVADWAESCRTLFLFREITDPLMIDLVRDWLDIIDKSYRWIRNHMRSGEGHFSFQYRSWMGNCDPNVLRMGNALMWEAMEIRLNLNEVIKPISKNYS